MSNDKPPAIGDTKVWADVTDVAILAAGLGDPSVCEESLKLRVWVAREGSLRFVDGGNDEGTLRGIWTTGEHPKLILMGSAMAHARVINGIAHALGRDPERVLAEIAAIELDPEVIAAEIMRQHDALLGPSAGPSGMTGTLTEVLTKEEVAEFRAAVLGPPEPPDPGPRVVETDAEPHEPVEPGTNRRHTWDQFREAGMLWSVNRVLHIFGWSIVVSSDDDTGEVLEAYPVRSEWRGFHRDREELGYRRVSAWMKRAAPSLDEEVGRD